MGMFDFLKTKGQNSIVSNMKALGQNSPNSFVDARSVSPD